MLNETYRAMLGNKSVIRETFMYGKKRAAEIGYENVFDYSLGNPSVPCPPEFTAAMQDLLANEEPVNHVLNVFIHNLTPYTILFQNHRLSF